MPLAYKSLFSPCSRPTTRMAPGDPRSFAYTWYVVVYKPTTGRAASELSGSGLCSNDTTIHLLFNRQRVVPNCKPKIQDEDTLVSS